MVQVINFGQLPNLKTCIFQFLYGMFSPESCLCRVEYEIGRHWFFFSPRFQTNTSQDSHIPIQPPEHKFQGAGRACGTWSSAWMDARYQNWIFSSDRSSLHYAVPLLVLDQSGTTLQHFAFSLIAKTHLHSCHSRLTLKVSMTLK